MLTLHINALQLSKKQVFMRILIIHMWFVGTKDKVLDCRRQKKKEVDKLFIESHWADHLDGVYPPQQCSHWFIPVVLPFVSSPPLSRLLSVWFGTSYFGAPGSAGGENPGISSRQCDSSASFRVFAIPLFSQTCSQKPVLQWHGPALQIPPFGLGENWLGAVLRGWCCGLSPVGAANQYPQVFPVNAPVPGRTGGWRVERRRWTGREGWNRQWDCGITSLWPISLRSALNVSIWKQPNYCWPLPRLQNTAARTN